MPTTHSLYKLIQKLTPSEKRFFTLFTQMGGGRSGNSSRELFEYLENLALWEDPDLSNAFQNPAISSNLSSVRVRLFDQILRTQRTLYDRGTAKAKLRSLIAEIALLFESSLYAEAKKRLAKHQALAQKFEYPGAFLEGLEWKQRIHLQLPYDKPEVFFARLEGQMKDALNLQQEIAQLYFSHQKMRGFLRVRQITASKKEEKSVFELIHEEINKTLDAPKGKFGHLLTLSIGGIFFLVQRNAKEAYAHYQKIVTFWQENPDWVPEYQHLYVSTLANAIQAYMYEAPPQQYLELLRKSREQQALSRHLRLDLRRRSYLNELLHAGLVSYYSEFSKLAKEIEAWLEEEGKEIKEGLKMVIYFNLCLSYFFHGELAKSNRIVLSILHSPEREGRKDIQDLARVIQIMIQFERGNLDLEAYLRRAATRYFRDKEATRLEQFTLEVLRSANRIPKTAWPKFFGQKKAEMEAELGPPTGKTRAGHQALELWLESKSIQTPLSELYRDIIRKNRVYSGLES